MQSWVEKEIFGISEHDGWRDVSDKAGEAAQNWFKSTLGYVPDERQLLVLFKNEPGLMLLLRRVWDKDYNKNLNKRLKKK